MPTTTERQDIERALAASEKRYTLLEQARDELEKRLRERTLELSAANHALEREIGERKRAQEAHLEALRRLVDAQEMERRRVSRELHDQLGQELTALKLGLKVFKSSDAHSPGFARRVKQLEALADNLMRDVHRLAWELRPVVLDDFGLELALQRYLKQWSEHGGVPVDFHSRGMETRRLPPALETTLYRVTQEALTNVYRHAGAKRVSVLLERRPDHVSLIVEDDGQGFDMHTGSAPGRQGKMGLLGMRERVLLAGGKIDVESGPGAGTTVFVRVPLPLE
jgi:signal transduction histidine kinase